MPPFLAGHVAIITGAGVGLGAGVAHTLAAAGAAAVLVSRQLATVEKVAQEIHALGGIAMPLSCDITRSEQITGMAARTLEAFGRIDFLINIAGTVVGIGKRIWELGEDEWRQVSDTNISGPLLLCRAIAPVMLQQGSGRILMLTSSSADMPTPTAAAYGASKAAVNQLVRALGAELDGSGVTVNAFNPGPVATDTLAYVEHNLEFGRWRGRWASFARSPEEAARIVLWLCSPAAEHLTGQTISWRDPGTQAALAEMEWVIGSNAPVPYP